MLRSVTTPITSDSVEFAVALLNSAEAERESKLQSMVLQRELSRRVHELNLLLEHPCHRELARQALASIGFEVSSAN